MRYTRWKTILAAAVAVMLCPNMESVSAQLMPIPDDTLGENASTLRPISPDYPGDVVEGGSRLGNALFHSFQEFHVGSNRAIYFDDPGVDSILSRVTGGVESQILGLLGVFGDADLFIINPNGIIFGRNARLDLKGGSFLATTADTVQFDISDIGLSTTLDPVPMLTVQPAAFLFNQANPAGIVNRSRILPPTGPDRPPERGLRVADGERITLLGGDITVDNGGLSALGGRVEVGGISEAGTVIFNADGSLEFPTDIARSDVLITNGSSLVASDSTVSGGSVTVTARTLDITDRSAVSAGTIGGSDFKAGEAGDITLDASSIRVVDSNVDNVVRGVRGSGGNVLITADDLLISDGSFVQSTLLGEGSTGQVKIDVRDRTTLDRGFIFSNLGGGDRSLVAVGDGGNIEITSPILLLTNGSQLQSGTFGQGNAGNVTINAPESVTLERSAIFSNVFTNRAGNIAIGDGGRIQITTPSLLARDSTISSQTTGQGNAGNVIINATESVTFENSRIFSDVSTSGANPIPGDGGNIQITTPLLSLTQNSELSSQTTGQGSAGNVTVTASDSVVFDDSRILSEVFGTLATGNGGNIQVTAPSLSLTNRSQFSSKTNGQGNGGNVRAAVGNLSLTGRSRLSASSSGKGDAGSVAIEAQERVLFDQGFIFVNIDRLSENAALANGAGNVRSAGSIDITAGSLDVINGSQLQSTTRGRGDAGNVTIRVQDRILVDGVNPNNSALASSIFATTRRGAEGKGGEVSLTADSIRLSDNGRVSTSTSNRSPGGNITVEANDLQLTGGGRFLSITSNDGRAGDIDLNIAGQTLLTGSNTFKVGSSLSFFSGLFASTTRNSADGSGGTVRLSTSELQVLDQARIEVDSQGGGTAGDMVITADTVRLDNGRLTAETAAVNGGNIDLNNLGLLLLRNGSLISTTAGTDSAGGNGGNVNISADAIVSVPSENSDIRANAFSGSGGNVRINSQGLFGIAAQAQDSLLTSDITASSEQGIQGTVDIATPEIDPRSGLTELPIAFADASNQITQTCSGNRDGRNSEFVVSGRGGLLLSPTDALIGDAPSAEWAALDEFAETDISAAVPSIVLPDRFPFAEGELIEAQGWTKENGTVALVALAPTSVAQTAVACR